MAIILKKSFKQPPKPNHQLTQKSPIHGSSETTKKTMPKKKSLQKHADQRPTKITDIGSLHAGSSQG